MSEARRSAREAEEPGLDAAPAVRIVVRPVGSPLPLGFLAFGVAIVVLSALELGWIPPDESHAVAMLILTFALPLEALAAVLAFLSRDTAGATGLSIFTASWGAIGVLMLTSPAGATSAALGVFLLAVALVIAMLAASSFQAKPLFGVLMCVAAARFVLTAVYQMTAASPLEIAAGISGLASGAFALYGGIALLLEDVKQRTVLPVGPRRGQGVARRAAGRAPRPPGRPPRPRGRHPSPALTAPSPVRTRSRRRCCHDITHDLT